jgi:hypothetical protein
MQLTIIKPDQLVIKDGRGISPVDMEGMEEEVRVAQWKEDTGHEELNDGTNVVLHDISKYQFMVERFDEIAYAIDNPPPPQPEEIQEANVITAFTSRDSLISKLALNDAVQQHGLPPIYDETTIVDMENQIRSLHVTIEYPPSDDFIKPVIPEPEIPQQSVISVMAFNPSSEVVACHSKDLPPGTDPSTITIKLFDAVVDGTEKGSCTLNSNGEGQIDINLVDTFPNGTAYIEIVGGSRVGWMFSFMNNVTLIKF